MPPKRTQSTFNPSSTKSNHQRPSSKQAHKHLRLLDENGLVDNIVARRPILRGKCDPKSLINPSTTILESASKRMAGGKRPLRETQTRRDGTSGKRTFATEIQNFTGKNAGDQLELLEPGRTSNTAAQQNLFDSDVWYAYSNLSVEPCRQTATSESTEIRKGQKSKLSDVSTIGHGDKDVDNRNYESLTQRLDGLSIAEAATATAKSVVVSDSDLQGAGRCDTQASAGDAEDGTGSVFSTGSVGASPAFAASRPFSFSTTTRGVSSQPSTTSSLYALNRPPPTVCPVCKASYGSAPTNKPHSLARPSSTPSTSSSTGIGTSTRSLAVVCQCHRYSRVFNLQNSFRSIPQQSTPVKAKVRSRSFYKIDISSPDVYGTLLDSVPVAAQSPYANANATCTNLYVDGLADFQQTTSTIQTQSQSSAASLLSQLTQQLADLELSSPPASVQSSPSSSHHESHSLQLFSESDTNSNSGSISASVSVSVSSSSLLLPLPPSPQPQTSKPLRHRLGKSRNPALLSPSLGYIPLAFPMKPGDFPFSF